MSLRYANSYIAVKAYEATTPDGVKSTQSLKPRVTEIAALQRMVYGDPIPASDAMGEAIRDGKLRCPRCNQYREPSCYATWKKQDTGVTYRKRYCNQCRHQMEKTKRYSTVEESTSYPRRVE